MTAKVASVPDRVRRLPRRTFLALLTGGSAVALAGCDALDQVLGDDGPDEPGVSPTAPPVDADSTLVGDVARAIAVAAALATATGTAVPALARPALRLTRLHEAHAAELQSTTTADQPAVTGDRSAARAALLQSEADLQDRLVDAARSAGSGALAQLFASMAAGVAQQRAALA